MSTLDRPELQILQICRFAGFGGEPFRSRMCLNPQPQISRAGFVLRCLKAGLAIGNSPITVQSTCTKALRARLGRDVAERGPARSLFRHGKTVLWWRDQRAVQVLLKSDCVLMKSIYRLRGSNNNLEFW